ncbi:MAG: chalcone isomerase family protein [Burkholderiaceae bacterium]
MSKPFAFAIRSSRRALGGAALALGLAAATATPAHARELAGQNLPEQVTVAGVPLLLNGAGVRYKAVFKVYTAALYLPRKSSAVNDALSTETPKRLAITMLREIDANELGKMFTHGLEDNLDRATSARLVPGILRMSQVFSEHKRLKEGESFQIDWVPGTGALLTIKGQPLAEPFVEPAFFQALLRIWLGDKPADWQLKDALLGKSGKAF